MSALIQGCNKGKDQWLGVFFAKSCLCFISIDNYAAASQAPSGQNYMFTFCHVCMSLWRERRIYDRLTGPLLLFMAWDQTATKALIDMREAQ